MKITYDPRYNIAYIRFKEKIGTVETIKLSEEMIVDMTPDGTVYGIELLNANQQLRQDNGGRVSFLNEATGKHDEIDLEVA